MAEAVNEKLTVFMRGASGAYLDTEFNTEHIAEMSQETYAQLVKDVPGADIQILEKEQEEDGE